MKKDLEKNIRGLLWLDRLRKIIKLCGVANIPNKSQTGSVENKIHKLSLLTAADVCTNIHTYKRKEVKVILFLSTTWKHIGQVEVQVHSFLTSAIDG